MDQKTRGLVGILLWKAEARGCPAGTRRISVMVVEAITKYDHPGQRVGEIAEMIEHNVRTVLPEEDWYPTRAQICSFIHDITRS